MSDLHFSASPWFIDGEFDDDVAVSIQTVDGIDICEIYPVTGEWSPEDIGNAKLVAASPQLFLVLNDAVRGEGNWAEKAKLLMDSLWPEAKK